MNTSATNPITTVLINETEVKPIEYKNQRVITLPMMDKIHGRTDGTARRRFNDNKSKLVEGEDYFEITRASVIRTLGLERSQGGGSPRMILLTETGYLLLVKLFTDDLSWKIQRQLVRSYFKAEETRPPRQAQHALPDESIPEPHPNMSADDKQILVDDLFNQINELLDEADRLTIVFRNTHLLANRIINTLVLTNPDQYIPVRLRTAMINREGVNK